MGIFGVGVDWVGCGGTLAVDAPDAVDGVGDEAGSVGLGDVSAVEGPTEAPASSLSMLSHVFRCLMCFTSHLRRSNSGDKAATSAAPAPEGPSQTDA